MDTYYKLHQIRFADVLNNFKAKTHIPLWPLYLQTALYGHDNKHLLWEEYSLNGLRIFNYTVIFARKDNTLIIAYDNGYMITVIVEGKVNGDVITYYYDEFELPRMEYEKILNRVYRTLCARGPLTYNF